MLNVMISSPPHVLSHNSWLRMKLLCLLQNWLFATRPILPSLKRRLVAVFLLNVNTPLTFALRTQNDYILQRNFETMTKWWEIWLAIVFVVMLTVISVLSPTHLSSSQVLNVKKISRILLVVMQGSYIYRYTKMFY